MQSLGSRKKNTGVSSPLLGVPFATTGSGGGSGTETGAQLRKLPYSVQNCEKVWLQFQRSVEGDRSLRSNRDFQIYSIEPT